MPAFTLGGTVSGGGNNINNVVIGASGALAGSFSTLSATGDITQSNAAARIAFSSAAGNGGLQNDTASAYALLYGSTHATLAKNVVLNSDSGAVRIKSTGTDIGVFTSTGLEVTGALSATGNTTVGFTGGTALLTGVATSNGFISHYLQNDSAGSSAVTRFMLGNNSSNGAFQMVCYGSNHATLPQVCDLNNANNAALRLLANNAVVAQVNPTSLALGVGISLTGGTSGTGYSFSGSAPATSLTLTSGGDVGVGTAGPVSLLETLASSTGKIGITVSNNNASAGPAYIAFKGYDWVRSAIWHDRANNAPLQFAINPNTTDLTVNGCVVAASFDSSGNLGVGTTSMGRKLNIAAPTAAGIQLQSTGTGARNFSVFATDNNASVQSAFAIFDDTASAYRMIIDSSGNLGLGVTPSAWGSVSYTAMQFANGGSLSAYKASVAPIISLSSNIYFDDTNERYVINGAATQYSQNQGVHSWKIAASGTAGNVVAFTQAMTLDASGNLLVGTTSIISGTNNKIAVESADLANTAGGIAIKNAANTTGGAYMRFANYLDATIGSITQSTSTAVLYNMTSDYRLKTVVGAVTGQGTRIDALQPIEYTWNSNGSRTRGFLAHQFQEVYADSVSGTKDAVDADGKPVYQAMQASTSEVIADLVAELQSLRARVAQLESKP
jgi:hypothetical protein